MKKLFIFCIFILLAFNAESKIYLDLEEEPLPLVDVTVILPVGFEASNQEEAGAGSLLPDILEGGSSKMTKQQFLDALGAYGADFDFSVSNLYSYFKINFPLVENKSYDGLIHLLSDLWDQPRFNKETFEISKTKLSSSIQGSLDNDQSLGNTTLRRWVNKKYFGGFPIFYDLVSKLKLETVEKLFERDFKNSPDIWAGIVAPKSSQALIEKLLKAVFKKQGELVASQYWKQLPPLRMTTHKIQKPSKTLLILDKSERSQSVTTLMSLSPHKLSPSSELAFLFGNHLTIDGGLDSYFFDEIRSKRGLAYSVFGVPHLYLGSPVIGFGMNPIREKSKEAFEVAADLIQSTYSNGSLFDKVSSEFWDRQWKGFKYGKILGQSTADQRLEERISVVTGALSPEFAQSNPKNWSLKRTELRALFSNLWKENLTLMAVVGKAEELRPMLEKAFKEFEIKVIPYKDSILSTTF